MNKRALYTVICGLITTLVWVDASGQKEDKRWSFEIYYDQDYTLEQLGLKSLNEDRNYTMGLGIAFSNDGLKKACILWPHYLLNKVFNKRNLNDRDNRYSENSVAMMIANGSFTPDYLPEYNVISNDRPYASITYLQTITTQVDNLKYQQTYSTLSMGLLGTRVSRAIQTTIHEWMNDHDTKDPRTPRGWPNQISNGGEFTATYAWQKEILLTTKAVSDEKKTSVGGIELKHGYGYSIGYYTTANYGLHFRLGQKDPRSWVYKVNALASSNKGAGNGVDYYRRGKTFQVYLFGSLRPTFVLYNALLNGQFKRSVHTVSFQDTRHFLLESDWGGALHLPVGKRRTDIALRLRISSRSPEFKLPGRLARFHHWGGIDLVIAHI